MSLRFPVKIPSPLPPRNEILLTTWGRGQQGSYQTPTIWSAFLW